MSLPMSRTRDAASTSTAAVAAPVISTPDIESSGVGHRDAGAERRRRVADDPEPFERRVGDIASLDRRVGFRCASRQPDERTVRNATDDADVALERQSFRDIRPARRPPSFPGRRSGGQSRLIRSAGPRSLPVFDTAAGRSGAANRAVTGRDRSVASTIAMVSSASSIQRTACRRLDVCSCGRRALPSLDPPTCLAPCSAAGVISAGRAAPATGELFALDVDDGDVVLAARVVRRLDQRLDHLLRLTRPVA